MEEKIEKKGSFLQRLFTSKREAYLLMMIHELKQTIEELRKDKEVLNEVLMNNRKQSVKIKSKPKSKASNDPLTPLERRVYDFIKDNPNKNRKEVSKSLKLSINTVNIYISKIKRKGFEL